MDIERFAQKRNYEIVRYFSSKKNQVALVHRDGKYEVLKGFVESDIDAAYRERVGLVMARESGVAVPMVRGCWYNRILLLEYIEGKNVADLTPGELPEVAPALARWFARLHFVKGGPSDTRFVHGDTILRNFVLMPRGGVAGVDLEEWEWGDPARDLAEIVASALTMDPPFTPEAVTMARRLHREYILMAPNPGNARLQRETVHALERIIERRPKHSELLREGMEEMLAHRRPFGR
ncbi:MAG: phosphotransferase [Bacillota bacterium]